jgi:predicted NBD/HSP70 family sugar kinase
VAVSAGEMSVDGSRPVVGVDVGGTWTVAVVVDGGGAATGRARLSTDAFAGIVDVIAKAVETALEDAGGRADPCAVGLGVPGQVDPETGTVRLALNLGIDEEAMAIGPAVGERLGVPVTLENDVRAAAVGAFEHLAAGAAPDLRSLAYLSIGTGISAGVVLDGRLHRGRDGMAGEIGHVVVAEGGPECRCGRRGCLEAVAAGPAIGRMWPSDDGRPAEAMLRAAASGDPAAADLVKEVVDRYVLALQWLATAWGADLIALGGGIGSLGEPLLGPVRGRLAALAAGSELARVLLPPERVVCVPADLPVGALGAAALARHGAGRDVRQPIDLDSGEPRRRGE